MKDQKIIEARKMLCQYLREVAKSKGITTQQIADATGFDQPNVVRMFNGKYSPTLDNFIILAEAVECYFFVTDKDADDDLSEFMRRRYRRESDEN